MTAIRTTSSLEQTAIATLGKEEVKRLMEAPIEETHRLFSQAYNRFQVNETTAYRCILLLKSMKV